MRKKNFFLLLVTLCLCIFAQAQMLSVYELSSPNGQLVLTVEVPTTSPFFPHILPFCIVIQIAEG